MDFREFTKIPRLSREMIITEKIDGTNGCISIDNASLFLGLGDGFQVGSRTRWITPEDDNFGFARWAYDHKDELIAGLGQGVHYGEWWGSGINRGYGLKKGEKRFSLFNVSRWADDGKDVRPACCHVVPVLYRGMFDTVSINETLRQLYSNGSQASKGFMNPEGIVIYHVAGNLFFKKTILHDEVPKGMVKE